MATMTTLQGTVHSRTFLSINPVCLSKLCPRVVCAVCAVGLGQSSSAGGYGCPSGCPSLSLFSLSLFQLHPGPRE